MQEEQNMKGLDKHDNPGAFYDYESWDDLMAAGGDMIPEPQSTASTYTGLSSSTSSRTSTSHTYYSGTTTTTYSYSNSGSQEDPIVL
jgi:hypothetical protein